MKGVAEDCSLTSDQTAPQKAATEGLASEGVHIRIEIVRFGEAFLGENYPRVVTRVNIIVNTSFDDCRRFRSVFSNSGLFTICRFITN